MSFALTTEQFKARTKTVTRRLGWWNLKPGDVVQGVRKAMGLRKGESPERLGRFRIVSTRREELRRIEQEGQVGCALEGFPEMTAPEFVEMFCRHMKVTPQTVVNRIEYEYLDEERP